MYREVPHPGSRSMKKGAIASANPWHATSLEWSIPSPPPFDNFAGVHPVVHHGPYEYAVPGAPKDFTMQTDPPEPVQTVCAYRRDNGNPILDVFRRDILPAFMRGQRSNS